MKIERRNAFQVRVRGGDQAYQSVFANNPRTAALLEAMVRYSKENEKGGDIQPYDEIVEVKDNGAWRVELVRVWGRISKVHQ